MHLRVLGFGVEGGGGQGRRRAGWAGWWRTSADPQNPQTSHHTRTCTCTQATPSSTHMLCCAVPQLPPPRHVPATHAAVLAASWSRQLAGLTDFWGEQQAVRRVGCRHTAHTSAHSTQQTLAATHTAPLYSTFEPGRWLGHTAATLPAAAVYNASCLLTAARHNNNLQPRAHQPGSVLRCPLSLGPGLSHLPAGMW
jgi:hypothetical protein